jgi:hypothetical protein
MTFSVRAEPLHPAEQERHLAQVDCRIEARLALLQRMPIFGGIRADVLQFLLALCPIVPEDKFFFRETLPSRLDVCASVGQSRCVEIVGQTGIPAIHSEGGRLLRRDVVNGPRSAQRLSHTRVSRYHHAGSVKNDRGMPTPSMSVRSGGSRS